LNGGGNGRAPLVMIFLLVLLFSQPTAATAQRGWFALQSSEIPASNNSSDRNGSNAATSPDANEKRKQQVKATAAVYLLMLVVIVCVSLLILVVLWGRRIRRLVRKPSKHVSLGDELWYLRPKKNQLTSERPSTTAADGQTPTETDHNSPETP
jgi:hypothetical protein